MKKLTLTAAVSAVLFAGAASAVTAPISENSAGLPVLNPSVTYQIFTSGSSAALPIIDNYFTNSTVPSVNRICDTTKKMYRFNSGSFSGSTFTANTDQRAYFCVLNTGSTANPAATAAAASGKGYAIVYKRSKDGSAQGVNPLVGGTEGSAIEFLNADVSTNTSCVKGNLVGNVQDVNCTWTAGNTSGTSFNSQAQISDLGLSDVEPILFQGDNTPSGFSAITATDVAKLTISPAATQVFGVVVNTKLRNALQDTFFAPTNKCNPNNVLYNLDKTGSTPANPTLKVGESAACMPSLPTSVITSIFAGKMVSWKQLYTPVQTLATGLVAGTSNVFDNVPAGNADKADSDRIHICTRTNGSGTKASFSALFLNDVCSDTGYTHPVDTGTTSESTLKAQVHQMSSGGNLAECLTDLNGTGDLNNGSFKASTSLPSGFSGVRWAIGIQGTENNATLTAANNDYRFIKIDGFEPTLVNVASGKYKNWSELTFQSNTTHLANMDSLAAGLVNELVTQVANPNVMGVTNTVALQSWGQAGFMAVPQGGLASSNGYVTLTKPVNPLSHGTKTLTPSTCRVPALYDGGTNGLRGLAIK